MPDDGDVAIDAHATIDAPRATFRVGGTIAGLWSGAAITLHVTAGDVGEDLTARAGEPFAFMSRLEDDASYLITVVDDGPDHDCVVDNGSGRIAAADADVHVSCASSGTAWFFR